MLLPADDLAARLRLVELGGELFADRLSKRLLQKAAGVAAGCFGKAAGLQAGLAVGEITISIILVMQHLR